VVIILFLSLLFLSAFFSGSETALLALNKLHLKRIEEKDPGSAQRIRVLLSKPRRLFFTILTGNTLVNTAATACVTVVAMDIFGPKGMGLAIGFVLVIVFIFGEILPKRYAYLCTEEYSIFACRPLQIAVWLLMPIRVLLLKATDKIINRLGFFVPKDIEHITEDEIKSVIKIGHREGVVDVEEKELIYGVFDFKGQRAKDIITPKADIKAIDADMPGNEIRSYAKDAKHSRLPVYRDTLDNIIGVAYAKDLLFDPGRKLDSVMREAYFIPESKKIDSLLAELQKRSIQMAIVTDEYGTTTGVVTMEDILEEIVGEIVDEYDKEEPSIVKIDADTYRIKGLLHIDEAGRALGIDIKTDEVDTMGGFAALILQRIPKENEEFSYGGYTFRISRVERHRIKELIVKRVS